MSRPVALLLVCLTFPAGLCAEEDASSAKDQPVFRLIAQLGSEKFAEREAAAQALDALGEPVLDILREAAAKHPDAEVRRRAQGLVRTIEWRAEEAMRFAGQVMRVVRLVAKESVVDVSTGQLAAWAVQGVYEKLDAKLSSSVQQRMGRARELSDEEAKALLRDALVPLENFTELFEGRDTDRAVKAMLARFDPYADWAVPDAYCDYGGNFGIGIRLEISPLRLPRVITPLRNGPAHKAGIQSGDLILRVERRVDTAGKPLPQPSGVSLLGLPLEQAQRRLSGVDGRRLHLILRRDGAEKPLEVEVVCGRAETETVLGVRRKKDGSWDHVLDREKQIGYARLTAFHRSTARDITRILDELSREGLKGLILDLRANPGGLLKGAVEIADLFVDDSKIVTLHSREVAPDVYLGGKEGSRLDLPLVCLIDRASASSSEIVAASLQDHKRATIIGERSRGRGSAQNIMVVDKHELTLTVAVFLRPNGRKLDRISLVGRPDDEWGVVPDKGFALELPAAERAALLDHLNRLDILPRRDRPAMEAPAFKDLQLDLALEHLRAQLHKR